MGLGGPGVRTAQLGAILILGTLFVVAIGTTQYYPGMVDDSPQAALHAASGEVAPHSSSAVRPEGPRPQPNPQGPDGPEWSRVVVPSSPPPRESESMVYDPLAGYVLMYGGIGGEYRDGNFLYDACLNDTWTFSAGTWSDLNVPGPPSSCLVAMAYDSTAQTVIAYVGSNQTTVLDQTWEFSYGRWTQLAVEGPQVYSEMGMSDDPADDGVLLVGNTLVCTTCTVTQQTWVFSGTNWTLESGADTPCCGWTEDPAWDGGTESVVMVSSASQCCALDGNATWAFDDGEWQRVAGVMSQSAVSEGNPAWGLTYDPEEGAMVLEDDWVTPTGSVTPVFETWIYEEGVWSNTSIAGPLARAGAGVAFDPADGAIILFGGCLYGASADNASGCLSNDTWSYGPSSMGLRLTVAGTPDEVCSAADPDCGAGVSVTRAQLVVSVFAPTSETVWGQDLGAGVINYGPFSWLTQPTLTFVAWGNLSPSQSLDPTAACNGGSESNPTCNADPSVTYLVPSRQALTWFWNGSGGLSQLAIGESWNISFNLQVSGPPYGSVPLDACATPLCATSGVSPIADVVTSFSASPVGNATRFAVSFPRAEIDVLGPLPSAATAPGSGPPPPAPTPTGVPTPVQLPYPTSPTTTSSPSPVAVSAGSAGPVVAYSAAALAAFSGLFTRIVVRPGALGVKVGVPLRVSRGPRKK